MTARGGSSEALPWLAALDDPATYPHPVRDLRVIHTHLSVVALTGEYAYKLKKPINYGFADFSTVALRRRYCEAELRLNRRTAPDLYLDVVQLARTPSGWRLVEGGGADERSEPAVRMRQFSDDARLDHIARRGSLSDSTVEALARRVAELHSNAAAADPAFAASYPERLAGAIRDNFKMLPEDDGSRSLRTAFDARLRGCAGLLSSRAAAGRVRDCHGDLHLGNICLWRGEPLLFDCIEFNDALRQIDVLSDAAFLWMDLIHSELASQAQLFLSSYLEITGDHGGLSAWSLFAAYRAHVRAKVACLTASTAGISDEERRRQEELRDRYLDLAARFVSRPRGGIVVLCGLPASGKSTEALRIARAEGGVRIRSDVERKRLREQDPSKQPYGDELTRLTYDALLARARAVTAGGLTAVLDATYLRREERARALQLASELGVTARIVHCEAPAAVLAERARARSTAGADASEADESVVIHKAAEWEPFTEAERALVTHAQPCEPRDGIDLDRMVESIRRIVALGIRRPGYAQDAAAEELIASSFRASGLEDVRFEPVPVHRWQPDETSLCFRGASSGLPCFPVPYTAWSGAEGIEAPCVFIGDGEKEDFERADVRGKIAVANVRFGELSGSALKASARSVHDAGRTIPDGPLHAANWLIKNFGVYFEAHRRGARAFLGLLVDSPIDGCEHYVPYDGHPKPLAAAWLGREHAAAIRDLAKRGATARFVSRGTLARVDSHNVAGLVRGRSATGEVEERLLVTCHHDAPFASAVEDASGLAVLLELARRFGATPGALERSLIFVASSGHFHGGTGNRVFVERHRDGLLAKTVAALGVEHIAEEVEGDGRGGYRLTGRPEVRALFVDGGPRMIEILEEEIRGADLDRTILTGAYGFGPEPPCDSAPYFTAGIPSACLISGPLYLFDPHDTIEKVRKADLVRVAGFFASVICKLDRVPAAELEKGLRHRRGDPPPPPPPWFQPPEAYK